MTMEGTPGDPAAEYRAARADAVLADRTDLGRLEITGKDAADLLHRLTTNDVRGLAPGQGTATAFVTNKGRLVDLVVLHHLDDRLLCLTGPGRSAVVVAYIDRYTFREDVKVRDLERSHGTLGLYGARASERAAALFGPEAAERPVHHATAVGFSGSTAILARTFPLGGGGFHLTAGADALPALRQGILDHSPGLLVAGPECIEALRIEAGLPLAGRELTEEYNPWEARLHDAISLNKGCYVGQEVIARLNTYKKVSRCLVRLEIRDGLPAPGSPIESGGETIGSLTSAAVVPGEDRVVALAYLRDEDAGREVVEVTDGGRRLRARVLGPAR
ncbi:MAG TPA: glycine cleavage T C-terminal barrel domain-containing protein [Candidatus Polarisedimenticolia bacterium]|jgi:aminomethyltransferase|nr:glycine cleavage T C-terminal barrel domain-containing protein [Candidatus Polarisedimenticolia bacterium]